MRTYNRFDSEFHIKYFVVDNDCKGHIGFSKNISMSGLCFRSNYHFRIGKLITIQIDNFEPPFCARAKVIWSKQTKKGADTGVKFEEILYGSTIETVKIMRHIDIYRKRTQLNERRYKTYEETYHELLDKPTQHDFGVFELSDDR